MERSLTPAPYSDCESDPDYEPSQESEDEAIAEEECDCHGYDEEHFFEGTGEDAVLSGLMTFVLNRKDLLPQHVPIYKELLRDLLNEANDLYR